MTNKLAVLVTCYNRHQITLPNLKKLISALDASDVEYDIHLLDDASPDETGHRVRERFPQIKVVREDRGNLFWTRGMQTIFQEAIKHGPYSAYLLFNDDVSVEASAVIEFLALYQTLNQDSATALVAATRSHDGLRISYTGMRRKSRHRPLSLERIEPGNRAVSIDTFNGNFVMIPASSLEAIGGLDSYYWHQFGDIDLGFNIVARGEKIFLAPRPIGCCDNNKAAVPSRHGLFGRLKLGLGGRENPRQHAYLIYKHSPTKIGATVNVAANLLRRIWILVANKPHVTQGSASAKF